MDLIERNTRNKHRHPWEMSRADSILKLIPSHVEGLQCADIGAGDQYFANRLAQLTKTPVYVVDSHYASNQDLDTIYQRRAIREIPKHRLDMIFLMDVLEHVENDRAFLKEAVECLQPGGTAIITVPAHPVLFSRHDIFLKHHRRYTAAALKSVITSCGLALQEFFYFYAPLLAVRGIQRLFENKKDVSSTKGLGEWKRPADDFLTRGVKSLLNLDFELNRALARHALPSVGLSICAITRTASA